MILICRNCKTSKSIDLFYTSNISLKKGLGTCIQCKKEYQLRYALLNKEKIRLRNLARRDRMPPRVRQRKKPIEQIRAYKAANKHKLSCRNTVQKALNRGKLKRLPCQVCGHSKTEAHHNDYAKPYDITWLCRKHHCELHRKYLPNGDLSPSFLK